MTLFEIIKQRIVSLDSATFQSLCDSYIVMTRQANIVSLGTAASAKKTTKGTPDTYYCTEDGKYVFIEYTTQKSGLPSKIKEDIEKCLDESKTKIPHGKISEIIYCHTSSNITPAQDNEFKTICAQVGITLTIIGLDKLASDITFNHIYLARDFLEIPSITDQIQSYKGFIERYHANKLATPLNTEFLFREREIKELDNAYENVDVVLLSGPAGSGKTRLALHYARIHSMNHHEQLYCIHNNFLPIFDDLKLYLNMPGDYFLLVDDADQLSDLHHIIDYANMKKMGYNVKILITVRDYAIQKVQNDIRALTNFQILSINNFTDYEIRKMITTLLKINNDLYIERIISLANGNARIAMLSGKIARTSNRLDSIDDISHLYEEYYAPILQDDNFSADENLIVSAGIIAFFDFVSLKDLDYLSPILQLRKLDKELFVKNIGELHKKEIVNIFGDTVQFADQCFSNYFLKYVLFDKKLLRLSSILEIYFGTHGQQIVSVINMLINIFRNQTLYNFIKNEVISVWNKFHMEKSPLFFDFVKSFHLLNQTETLKILRNMIEQDVGISADFNMSDAIVKKDQESKVTDIISILGNFVDSDSFSAALDLFFQYYLKRPDQFASFQNIVTTHFTVQKNSLNYNCNSQVLFFEKLKNYSDNWKNKEIINIFLKTANSFLNLWNQSSSLGKNNIMNTYIISITLSEGVKKYRAILWDYLFQLCSFNEYAESIWGILYKYPGPVDKISSPVLQFDLSYLCSIFHLYFPSSNLKNCILVDKLCKKFQDLDISIDSLFCGYFEEEEFKLYKLLEGPHSDATEHMANTRLSRQTLESHVLNCTLTEVKQLIDICSNLYDIMPDHFKISEGLGVVFKTLFCKELYFHAIDYYLRRNTPYDLNSLTLVRNLFTMLSDRDVFQLINKYDYSRKNDWLYAYYHELPESNIDAMHLQGLYAFLDNSSDKDLLPKRTRDVFFLEKYSLIDNRVFIKGCKIIYRKLESDSLSAGAYLESMFDECYTTPHKLVQIFNNDLDTLCKIYLDLLLHNFNHDFSGKFLVEIYGKFPKILDGYVECLLNATSGQFRDNELRHQCFLNLDNFIDTYDKVFNLLVRSSQYPTISVPPILSLFITSRYRNPEIIKKQDAWICHCIKTCAYDKVKISCLFHVISTLDNARKKKYIEQFLQINSSFEIFECIPLRPVFWSGPDAISVYSECITFLNSLLVNLADAKWLNHKDRIEKEIEDLKKCMDRERINEAMREQFR